MDGNSEEPTTITDDMQDKTYTETVLQSNGGDIKNTHNSIRNTDTHIFNDSEIEEADVSEQLPGTENNEEGRELLGKDEMLDTEDTTEQDKTDTSNLDGLPTDETWAWFVLAGCVINVILIVGYDRAIGILFVEFLDVFGASTTKTTLFMGVMFGVYSISSLFVMNFLYPIMESRKLVLLGGLITTLGMLTAVFATSITFLICTHSVLIGIGHSMCHNPGLVMVGQYFKKRRGLAMSVAMSGISISGVIYPPFIRYLIDEYGVRGSMLILTGVTMNIFVGGLLYRPLNSYGRRKSKIGKQENNFVEKGDNLENVVINHSVQDCETIDIDVRLGHPKILGCRSDHNEYSNDDEPKNPLQMYYSHPELASISMSDIKKGDAKSICGHGETNSINIREYFKKAVALFDLKLLRNPMFQLIVVISHFAVIFELVTVYLPALATEKGIPPTETSLLLTISSSLDFVSRLALGFFADLKWMKVHHIMAIGLILAGTVTHFTFLYSSNTLLVLFSVLAGLFGSSYRCLTPVYIVEFVGLKNMARTIGFASAFHGCALSVSHPIIGAIRDWTGSYDICFNYIGVCSYIAAICLFCEPLARRRLSKHPQTDDDESVPTA